MKYYMTKEGYERTARETQQMEKELKKLQSKTQETAEQCGDLWHDNPSLYELKGKISMLDNRLSHQHKLLSNSQIVEYPKSVDAVCLGAEVHMTIDGKETIYKIVGYGESDMSKNKIAYDTPIAKALMGHKPNSTIDLKVNGYCKSIKILKVSPIKEDLEEKLSKGDE